MLDLCAYRRVHGVLVSVPVLTTAVNYSAVGALDDVPGEEGTVEELDFETWYSKLNVGTGSQKNLTPFILMITETALSALKASKLTMNTITMFGLTHANASLEKNTLTVQKGLSYCFYTLLHIKLPGLSTEHDSIHANISSSRHRWRDKH